ncbi:hypothetical protein HK104_008052, partial [Borealophlyctis nickersoniae]
MSIKPTVKSLEIRLDNAPKTARGHYLVEAGWGVQKKLSGTVEVVTRRTVKEAKLTLELRGESNACWRDLELGAMVDMRLLINDQITLVDARNSSSPYNMSGEARIFSIPFSFNLPADNLPETYEDDKVSNLYELKAKMSWNSLSGKQIKDWQAALDIRMPKEARTRLLENQKPVLVTNNEKILDETTSYRPRREDFTYSIHVPRT